MAVQVIGLTCEFEASGLDSGIASKAENVMSEGYSALDANSSIQIGRQSAGKYRYKSCR